MVNGSISGNDRENVSLWSRDRLSSKNKLVIEDCIIRFSGLDDAALESHLPVLEFAIILHG